MPDNPQHSGCPKKGTIDELAQDALDKLGRIATTDKKIEMQLGTVKDNLRQILADHHHL